MLAVDYLLLCSSREVAGVCQLILQSQPSQVIMAFITKMSFIQFSFHDLHVERNCGFVLQTVASVPTRQRKL